MSAMFLTNQRKTTTMNQPLLNDEQLNEALLKSPAARITEKDITNKIASVEYYKLGQTVTVCNITLDNGFSVRGESACVMPENYNQEIGQTYAYKKAFSKLWDFLGFMLAEDNWRRHSAAVTTEAAPVTITESGDQLQETTASEPNSVGTDAAQAA